LHNKLYTGYDIFGQWATTIYCGSAYWLWNEWYD